MGKWNQLALVFLLGIPCFGQTTQAAKAPEVPILLEAAMPIYPPIWRTAHITGKVVVFLTVKDGRIVGTDVKSGRTELQIPTIANLKTWRCDDGVNGAFTVTFTYKISGEEIEASTNPKVEMLPSLDVTITARPVKPTVNYSNIPIQGTGS
jgi:hypothetical protein